MNRAYRASNPDKYRDHELKKYGLSVEDYNAMLIAQEGRCAICKRIKKKLNLAVDHNHKTGAVRGLLCAPCNRHVGWFEAHGQAVVEYLKRNE